MQWLRHTRNDAPTHNEQATELIRQAQIKHLAAQADARWKAQASYLEQPKPPAPGLSLTLGAGIPSGQQQGAAVEDLVAKSEESVKLASEEIRSATTARKSKKATRWEDIRLGKNVTEQQPETWVPRPVKRG
jgi:NADH dehydrogenase [ubiquinone] 1 alpha subcomplex assembly factor 2